MREVDRSAVMAGENLGGINSELSGFWRLEKTSWVAGAMYGGRRSQ